MTAAIIILLCLFLINGFFVMTEISLISARKTKLDLDAQSGDKLAQSALEHANNPAKVLSTVQVGITLIGILTGVFSSDEIAGFLDTALQSAGMDPRFSHTVSLVIVVMAVTFISMLIGELVPKRIGLTNPEKIAKRTIRPILFFFWITYPFTVVLSWAGDLIMKVLRIRPSADSRVTEEEIKAMVQEGADDGEVQEIEQDIVERVFHLGDRKISSLMTHHSDLIWIDVRDTAGVIRDKIQQHMHSVYPVCEGDIDKVLGVLFIKQILFQDLSDQQFRIREYIKAAQFILETLTAYEALEIFRKNRIHYGLVVDEYGSTVGMVTMNDILEALVGDFNDAGNDDMKIVQREDGSWLADGQMSFYEFAYEFNVQGFDKNKIKFDTLAGLAMSILRHIPKPGEKFHWKNFEFEVVDLDGNRIDKLIFRQTKQGTDR